MKNRNLERELTASFEKIKKEAAKPLFDTNKYGKRKPGLRIKKVTSADTLARVQNRIPNQKSVMIVSAIQSKKVIQSNMEQEEYDRREKAAREVKHCIMPLHKGNYILVTDEEMVKQMGKKTA